MTPAPADAAFPPGRYGHRRDPVKLRRRRWITFAVGALVLVTGLVITVKLFRQYGQSPYQVNIISVTDLTDHAVTVTFDVNTPSGAGASCTVVAHTRDGEQVGLAEVAVPAGAPDRTSARVTYTLATTKRPVTGEVPGCGPPR